MILHQGDTIIVTAPAGRVLDENMDNAVVTLESWGLNVLVSPHAKREHFNFSGTAEERRSDVQWALDHCEAKAIFAARGGYGAIHLLNQLDWTLFKKHPKLFIGYSDITNLHACINHMGIGSLHALMPNSFPKFGATNPSLDTLKVSLFDSSYSLEWQTMMPTKDVAITAPVVGGNLSILYSLQGTPYAPDYKGKILFIEEVNEYLYHVDRMLYNFELSGILTQVKGVVVGDFSEMKDNEVPFGKTIEQTILDRISKYDIPVVFGLKAGHGQPTLALPLGQPMTLEVKNNVCRLF